MGAQAAARVAIEREETPPFAAARPLLSLQIGMRWLDSGAGGLDRVFHDLANSLPGQGVAVHGLVVQPADVAARTGGRIEAFAAEGANLPGRLLGVRHAVRRLVAGGGIDLVAGHFALYLSAALASLGDRPLVQHFHGPWARESGFEGQKRIAVMVKKAIERRVYSRADRFIVLSKAFADLLSRDYGVDPERIRIVPGSVDLDRFNSELSREKARAALGWATDRPILLATRRLIARVGLDQLIDAIQIVRRSVPDVLLLIAGRGPLEAVLRRQIEEGGLRANVRLLGFLPDDRLPLAYRAADINVVPTAALEGFGLTAAEALAAGTPSMVTPIGGLPEVVADLAPELVFASGAASDLAAGLCAALKGEIVLPGSAACRAYAEARFATGLAAARTASVYRELLA
jgi:glycogen(starch) synthase